MRSQHRVETLVGAGGGGFVFDTNSMHRGLDIGSANRTVVILEVGRCRLLLPCASDCFRLLPIASESDFQVASDCFRMLLHMASDCFRAPRRTYFAVCSQFHALGKVPALQRLGDRDLAGVPCPSWKGEHWQRGLPGYPLYPQDAPW